MYDVPHMISTDFYIWRFWNIFFSFKYFQNWNSQKKNI
jgi:hypothetical protein